MKKAKSLGELRGTPWESNAGRSVKQELRDCLIKSLKSGQKIFPGIVGYEKTVIPQVINAILSKHNFILLGLRGQAKTRILRQLTDLLEDEIPVIADSELNDDPFKPVSIEGKSILAECGDATPISWLAKEARYIEKLATPDVTVADIIGDIDPIKAAKLGTKLSDERSIHYGLLPRANRGIFSMNELPDLSGKVQVALFNIMQEGDVQIKGYPVRLPLDVMLVFSANPEDYTARGNIITPLKDRIGSEVRTHYPHSIEQSMSITAQEAWIERDKAITLPSFIAEIVDEVAFQAREDIRVDKHSGVSQRLPISLLENVLSNAEQRALLLKEKPIARVVDIYNSLAAITGKLELEYEGELKGGEAIATEIVRRAIGQVFSRKTSNLKTDAIVEYFEADNFLKLPDNSKTSELSKLMTKVPELIKIAQKITEANDSASIATTAEFILEGLYARKRIACSEEQGYSAAEIDVEAAPPKKWN